MSKHTPGPWKILAFVPDERYEIATADSTNGVYRSVATVTFGYSEPAETEQHANAKLIAVAPELLKSCQALLEELRLIREKDGPFVYDTTCRIEARAAIAKATGEA